MRENDTRPVVMIGPLNRDLPGGVAAVHSEIVAGVGHQYRFIEHTADRTAGSTKAGLVTILNFVFAVRDLVVWAARLMYHRPAVAHYALTSLWSAEKSLTMLTIAHVFGVRTIAHLHGGAFVDFWGSIGPVRRSLLRGAVARLDAMVVLSPGWRQAMLERFRIPPERVFVVPNAVGAEFEREAQAFGPDPSGTTVLALGALSKLKGTEDLLEAMVQLKGNSCIRLILAGPERDPGIRRRLEKRIEQEELHETVELHPPVHGAGKLQLFRRASIFVLPSYFENLPVVALEAAAAGLPIIATPVGALPEFFRDGESIRFVSPGDVEQLSRAIEELARSQEFRYALGTRARTVFREHFTHATIMDRMAGVYRSVLAGARRTTAAAFGIVAGGLMGLSLKVQELVCECEILLYAAAM